MSDTNDSASDSVTDDERDDAESVDESAQAFSMRDVVWPIRLDLVWLLLPATLTAIAFGMLPLRSWDYWWHISFGRLFDQWGRIPAANHVLYTMPAEAVSIVQPWLSQWLLYEIHEGIALEAVIILRNVIAAIVFLMVTWTAIRRSESPVTGAVLTALMAVGVSHGVLSARTYLLVWPIFATLLVVALGIRAGRLPWWLVVAWPVVTIPWTNMHGSFLMPAVIAGAFAAASFVDGLLDRRDDARRGLTIWGLTAVASILATYGNPRGFDIYAYLYNVATNPTIQATVSEWQMTTFTNPPALGPIVIVSMIVTVGLMIWRRDELDPVDVILFAGFAFLAIRESRAILWWVVVWPLVTAPYLKGVLQQARGETHEWAAGIMALVLVVGSVVAQPFHIFHADWVIALEPIPVRQVEPMRGRVPAEMPVEPAQIMQGWGTTPRLFHDLRYAGYLMYELDSDGVPDQAFFVDSRIELPPEDVWTLYDLTVTSNIWKGVFQQYNVMHAVLDAEKQSELIEQIVADPEWGVIWENERVVFVGKRRR